MNIQNDDKVLIAYGNLVRLNVNGSIDTSFDPPNVPNVKSIEILSDNSIVVVGYFSILSGHGIAKLNNLGEIDVDFQTNIANSLLISTINSAICVDYEDNIYIGGIDINDTVRKIVKLNNQGVIDFFSTSYLENFTYVSSMKLQNDGKIIVAGKFVNPYSSSNNLNINSILRFHDDYCVASSNNINISACENYLWNGSNYSESGSYTYHLTNSNGCDSTVTLNLNILNSSNSADIQSACQSFTWIDGNTYTSSTNTPSFVLTNSNGCDSIVILNLTIHQPNSGSENITSCTSYSWNGNTYSASGTYTANLVNSNGCDSLATLNLTILESTTGSETVENCENYTWHGTTYSNSGTYTTTLTNSNGCDSIVTLNLTINPLPTVNLPNLGSYCDTLDSFAITGGTPAGGQYSGTSVNNNNFDPSIGEGTYTITYTYSDANACSNSDNGNLTVIECINTASLNESTISTFKIYPNPASSEITIEVNNDFENNEIKLFDLSSKLMFSSKITSNKCSIDVSSFSKGIYFVEIGGVREKFVVE